MKDTAFKAKHEALGAKLVPFAGYTMPLQYEGLTAEHKAVRDSLGVFDVSHMGEFILKGDQVLDLLQLVTSNDVSKLADGGVQYSCLPNTEGGIVDDLLVYRIDATTYMLVVNASNIDKDWAWIEKHNSFGVEMTDISEKTALLAVQGPNAVSALKGLTDMDLEGMKYYTFAKGVFAGIDNVLVSATGYTGAGGFEIYFDGKDAGVIWDAVMEAGAAYDIKPCGLAARDTLRLEMGFCLYGNDINDTTSPIEAGLGWITKFTKDFTNASSLKAQKEAGVAKKLVGFELLERGIPRKDYELHNAAGEKIGVVTSGTMAPSLNKAIGLGYVDAAHSKSESEIFVSIRGKAIPAKVVRLPFYKAN